MYWIQLATLFLLLIFIVSGVQKALGYIGASDFSPSSTATFLSSLTGLPTLLTSIALFIAVAIELLAPPVILAAVVIPESSGMASIFGMPLSSLAYLGVLGLILFTILATLAYHFPTDPSERISFMKNLSILGGLILLANRF